MIIFLQSPICYYNLYMQMHEWKLTRRIRLEIHYIISCVLKYFIYLIYKAREKRLLFYLEKMLGKYAVFSPVLTLTCSSIS